MGAHGVSSGTTLVDCYAAWLARGGRGARGVEAARQAMGRWSARLVAEVGFAAPWAASEPTRTDHAEMQMLVRQRGCPACRYLAEAEARSYFWFLMEGYGEGEWINRLIGAGGFCPRHLWRLADSGRAYRITYVVQYLTQDLRARLGVLWQAIGCGRRPAHPLASVVRTRPCPMCLGLDRDLDWLLRRFVRCLADEPLAAAYAAPGCVASSAGRARDGPPMAAVRRRVAMAQDEAQYACRTWGTTNPAWPERSRRRR